VKADDTRPEIPLSARAIKDTAARYAVTGIRAEKKRKERIKTHPATNEGACVMPDFT